MELSIVRVMVISAFILALILWLVSVRVGRRLKRQSAELRAELERIEFNEEFPPRRTSTRLKTLEDYQELAFVQIPLAAATVPKKRILVWVGIGALAVLVLVTVGYLTGRWKPDLVPTLRSVVVGVFYFMIMLAGMAAEYMFGLKSLSEFKLAEFVRPFWVALIVFSVPWTLVDKEAVNYASLLACYQNGFFWKKVLERTAH